MEDFISLNDLTTDEVYELLDLADKLKKDNKEGRTHHVLEGKSLGMIFSKSSTRTRVSFEVGMYQLGGQALFLSTNDIQLGRGEPIRDTACVLSRFLDGIMIRTYKHSDVLELAKYASIPVINALTDDEHPCQVLADLQCAREKKGDLKSLKFAYIGDGNNMANSLMHGFLKVGAAVAVASPKDYTCTEKYIGQAKAIAKETGAELLITEDPVEAIRNADVVYTDTWASMGQEAEKAVRVKAFQGYTIDKNLWSYAAKDAIFMHCLPAYRGYEVTEDVIDGPQSVIYDEAENRLHAQKAVMVKLMAGK